jgi:hypothetical protein
MEATFHIALDLTLAQIGALKMFLAKEIGKTHRREARLKKKLAA